MARRKNLSLSSQNIRYKLKIAFYLMSILPLLVCLYLVSNYILPKIGLRLDIFLAILVSIVIAVIGLYVVKEVFDRIITVATEAKLIASGDVSRKLKVGGEDEVGDLGFALNQLTQRIRSNMDELKNYSEKTTEINFEIQKRVIVLSGLLQISSLISQGAKLEDIFKLTTEKARLLAASELAFLFLKEEETKLFEIKVAEGINAIDILKIKLEPKENIFERVVKINKPLIIDKINLQPENISSIFNKKFNLKNALALPVFLKGKVMGVLGVGNTKDNFSYKNDDIELLDIFAKQIAIAMENDILMHQVEKLEIKDLLTGLYNETFIRSHLQEEIKRAITYQRPCSFILLNINAFEKIYQNFGSLQAESFLKKIALLIKDSIGEIDRAARFSDNQFAIVLPEKNKRQAQEAAEKIKKKIEFSFSEEGDSDKRLSLSIGIGENPLDGIETEELIKKAQASIKTG